MGYVYHSSVGHPSSKTDSIVAALPLLIRVTQNEWRITSFHLNNTLIVDALITPQFNINISGRVEQEEGW